MKHKEKKRVLFIPSLKKGNGTGHFRRCIRFADNDLIDGRLYVPAVPSAGDYGMFDIQKAVPNFSKAAAVQSITPEWDCIVLDCRNTETALLRSLPDSVPIVALDEGSPTDSMDYLIDLLPGAGRRTVNLYDPLLGIDSDIPVRIRESGAAGPLRILVSFGGEDATGLSAEFLRAIPFIRQQQGMEELEFTIVKGPLFSEQLVSNEAIVLDSPARLSSLLHSYDLLVCSFGVTGFEAWRAGVPVVHVNPSAYHTKLSRKAGFQVAGTGRINASRLASCIRLMLTESDEVSSQTVKTDGKTLPEILDELVISKESCPLCKNSGRRLLARFRQRNFFRCTECSMIWQMRCLGEPGVYNEEYFFTEYSEQYGKTYLEDYDNIRSIGLRRMKEITSRIKPDSGDCSLLDIGCAYGPFLEAGRLSGCNAYGIDVSATAVEYVNRNPEVKAWCASFPDQLPVDISDKTFDIISMWYVIEHFDNPDLVLKSVSRLLKDRGVFAFSTPNFRGISGWCSPSAFLQSSPEDHKTLWTPAMASKILKSYGFAVYRIRSTGIHPKRFPAWIRWLPKTVLLTLAAFFRLGDTFEIYAIKKHAARIRQDT